MSQPTGLPEELRRALAADSAPVRPVAGPARRSIAIAVWAPVAAALLLVGLGVRPDAATLGAVMTWGPTLVEVFAGLVLVALALAESVPARGAPRSVGTAAVVAAALVLLVEAWLTHAVSPGSGVGPPFVAAGLSCLSLQLMVGLPAVAITALMVLRAAPLRAAWAGLLGGVGSGLLAEGVYRLHCPVTELAHVLVWHGGAVLVLALVGLATGVLWDRRQARRLAERLGSRAGR